MGKDSHESTWIMRRQTLILESFHVKSTHKVLSNLTSLISIKFGINECVQNIRYIYAFSKSKIAVKF